MELRDLAAAARDRKRFRREHPHAALVFLKPRGRERGSVLDERARATVPASELLASTLLPHDESAAEEFAVALDSTVLFLEKTPFLVGRMKENDACLSARSVSKFHAVLSRHDIDGWMISDSSSSNGTWVDAKRIRPGPALLRDGARIAFGPDMLARFTTPDGLLGLLDF